MVHVVELGASEGVLGESEVEVHLLKWDLAFRPVIVRVSWKNLTFTGLGLGHGTVAP